MDYRLPIQGTEEQVAAVQRAFEMLPEDARKVIARADIKWRVGGTHGKSDITLLPDRGIAINPELIKAGDNILAADIYAAGLQKILEITFTPGELESATREHVAWSSYEGGDLKELTIEQRKIVLNAQIEGASAQTIDTQLINVLTGGYAAAHNQTKNPSKAPARDILYRRYMKALEREARKEVAPQAPAKPAVSQSGPGMPSMTIDPDYVNNGFQPEDMSNFVDGYRQWPGWVKDLIAAQGITFQIGRYPGNFNKDHVYDPMRRIVEIDVADTNTKESRKDKQTVALISALLCIMHNHMPPNLNWDEARREMTIAAAGQNIALDNISQTIILANIHRTKSQNGGEAVIKDTAPESLNIYETFMASARQIGKKTNKSTQTINTHTSGISLPAPTLENAKGDEQELFTKAFDSLEPHVKYAIVKAGVQFAIGTAGEDHEVIKDGKVVFDSFRNESRNRILASIQSFGLVRALDVKVPDEMYNTAFDEHCRQIRDAHVRGMKDSHASKLAGAVKERVTPENTPRLKTVKERFESWGKDIMTGRMMSMSYQMGWPSKVGWPIVELYDKAAREQYEKDTAHEASSVETLARWKETYKASDTAFAINREPSALTSPQQQYFEKLNETVALLGVKPKEFDDQFKFSVAHAAHICGAHQLLKEAANVNAALKVSNPIVERMRQEFDYGQLPHNVTALTLRFNKPTFKIAEEMSRQSESDNMAHLLKITGFVAAPFECINLPLPEQADAYERNLHKKINFGDKPLTATVSDGRSGTWQPGGDIILQRIAAGQWRFAHMQAQRMSYETPVGKYETPSYADFTRISIANAILTIAKKKGIDGERYEQLIQKLGEMEALWPQAVMDKKQYADFLTDAEIRAQRAQEKENQRLRREASDREPKESLAAQEKEPKPYRCAIAVPKNHNELLQAEISVLCKCLNTQLTEHQQLGDALFKGPMGQLVSAVLINQPGNIRSALDNGKNKGITQALGNAKTQIVAVLAGTQYQSLQAALCESPILLACVTGNMQNIDTANVLHEHEFRIMFVQEELLPELRGEKKIAVLSPPSPLKKTPVEEIPMIGGEAVVPVTVVTAAIAATAMHALNATPMDEPLKEATSLLPPVKAETKPVIPELPNPPATILDDEPTLPLAELEGRRAQAYTAMLEQLSCEAEIAGLRAIGDGYNQFRCDLLVNGKHARIRLLFKSDDARLPPYEQILDLNSRQYEGGYARLGVVPTTLDAINLRIAVNSEIAGDGDFTPILSKTGSGTMRVGKNDFIPNRAIHPEERKLEVKLNNSNDIYQLELTSRFTKRDDAVTIVFPLGIKGHDPDNQLNEDARRIADLRADIVRQYIDDYNGQSVHRRRVPVKGEIQMHLENEILQLRNADPADPLGHWDYPERIQLLISDGLRHPYLMQTDPAYVDLVRDKSHVNRDEMIEQAQYAIPRIVALRDEDDWELWSNALEKKEQPKYRALRIPIPTLDPDEGESAVVQPQMTTMGAPALSHGGSNHTYHLQFSLQVSDDPDCNTAGHTIRGRSINLCIDDPEVARSRSEEVLFGNDHSLGFLHLIMNYFAQHPQARWMLEDVKRSGGDDTERKKKKLVENIQQQVQDILGQDVIKDYRQMVKNALPITDTTRRLHVERGQAEYGEVALYVQIQQQSSANEKLFETAQDSAGHPIEMTVSVPEKKAAIAERYLRGDMDSQRLDILISNLIPRFEHDLCVRTTQGEPENGNIPVTFSVMRGRRDNILEQHLGLRDRPVRMQLRIPEHEQGNVGAYAKAVDEHLSLLAATYYSPIIPVATFDKVPYDQLRILATQQRTGDGFIDNKHPDFNANAPKDWLQHAIKSNIPYHFQSTPIIDLVDVVGGRRSKDSKLPKGKRERVPSDIIGHMRDIEPNEPLGRGI